MRLIELFREILAYPFLARAIVSGVLIATTLLLMLVMERVAGISRHLR